jgi:hypothetical protein
MPRGRRPIAAAAAEERCSFEAHRPKSFECSSTATFVSTSCETSTLRAGFLRRRHTLSCSFSRLLKIPQRKLRASDPSSSSKVYIEGPGESERERYILDSLTDGSYGHGGLKHVSSDSSLFTDATWRSTPPTSTFFPRHSAGGSFSSTVAPSISQHSSSASLSAIAAALSTSTTPSGLHTSHFFSAPCAPPSTPRLHDWHGFDSDAQVSRSEFWCVLRAGLDVHKYKVSEMLVPPPSPPLACSRLQRAGSQPVNSLKPPTHPNLQRSKSTGKVLQLKRLYRDPPAVSDEGCGMVTLFLDEGGDRLCWCTPGKALLRPNAAHCIFLSSICGVTVDDSGSSSSGSSSKRERSHSRSFGSDVSGNSSDSSSCSSSAGAPQQQQQQRAVRQQGTTITLHCRSRARPLKLSVDVAHIRTLLAGGFRKLAERNNALHANSVLASAQSTQQHISEQQQQLFEEAVAAATADEQQQQQQQQQYQRQYRQQQQQHTRVLSGAFCAVPAMKGDLAPAAVAVATVVAAVAVEQQQPQQQQQLQQQRTAVALSH